MQFSKKILEIDVTIDDPEDESAVHQVMTQHDTLISVYGVAKYSTRAFTITEKQMFELSMNHPNNVVDVGNLIAKTFNVRVVIMYNDKEVKSCNP